MSKSIPLKKEVEVSVEYYDTNIKSGRKQKVSVILKINYINKTYSIMPHDGALSGHFGFLDGNCPEKWTAVCDAIKMATTVGARELEEVQ